MTELSPAAQAMLDAMYEVNMDFDGENATLAAAVLEAVAAQVVPKEWPTIEDYNEYDQGVAAAHIKCRNQLLAIAAELRGDTTATQEESDD